jgi:hypothetical protein
MMNWKGFERKYLHIIEAVSWHLPGETEETHKNTQPIEYSCNQS